MRCYANSKTFTTRAAHSRAPGALHRFPLSRLIGVLVFYHCLVVGPGNDAWAGAALQISPVLIDLQAPASAATIDIANQAPQPAQIQVRVFRWKQADGHETLTPTEDVVASPPFATIASGTTLSVRVIRASKAPIAAEEAYRVVVDQLPETNRSGHVLVAMLLRQVLPVFFGGPEKSAPDVSWNIRRASNGVALFAHNNGDRRLRVAHVVLTDSSRHSVTLSNGLLGYALGHSDMSWPIPAKLRGLALGAAVTIHVDSDMGAVSAKALISGRE